MNRPSPPRRCSASPPPPIASTSAPLWFLDTAAFEEPSATQPWLARLAPHERRRYAAYQNAGARRDYLGTRALVRTALAHSTGLPAERLRFGADPLRRPELHRTLGGRALDQPREHESAGGRPLRPRSRRRRGRGARRADRSRRACRAFLLSPGGGGALGARGGRTSLEVLRALDAARGLPQGARRRPHSAARSARLSADSLGNGAGGVRSRDPRRSGPLAVRSHLDHASVTWPRPASGAHLRERRRGSPSSTPVPQSPRRHDSRSTRHSARAASRRAAKTEYTRENGLDHRSRSPGSLVEPGERRAGRSGFAHRRDRHRPRLRPVRRAAGEHVRLRRRFDRLELRRPTGWRIAVDAHLLRVEIVDALLPAVRLRLRAAARARSRTGLLRSSPPTFGGWPCSSPWGPLTRCSSTATS